MNRFLLLSIISTSALLLSGCADLNHAYQTVSTSVKSTVENITTPSQRSATTENLLTTDNVSKNCPHIEVINELASLSEFSDITQPKEYNLVSRVQIQKGASNCIYSAGNVRVDVKLILESVLGQQGQQTGAPSFTYPFFVAVTDQNNNILAKEVFSAAITHKDGELRQTYFENLRQIIPIETRADGKRHKILVGFQLSDDQLAYNRATLALPLSVDNGADINAVNDAVIEAVPQEINGPIQDVQTLNVPANGAPIQITEDSAQQLAEEVVKQEQDQAIINLNKRSQNKIPVEIAPPF